MNQIILIGRIVQELDLRITKNEKQYTFVKLAVNRDKDNTDFIDCIAWEKTAELLMKYAKKGTKIAVQGSLQIEKKNNNGTWTEKHLVIISKIEFCEPKSSEIGNTSNYHGVVLANKQKTEIKICCHGIEKNSYEKCLDCEKDLESEDSVLWN